MKNLLVWVGAIALALMPTLAPAQSVGSSVIFPAGYAPSYSICIKQVDGTCVPVSTTAPLQTASQSDTGGVKCVVVSGDQSYTVGQVAPITCTATGRVKVGLSSAGNVAPAATAATNTTADLVACTYRTTVTWTIGWTGAIACDASGNLLIAPHALTAGSATIGNVLRATYWNESTTPPAASGQVNGTARDSGGAGTTSVANTFMCAAFANQAGGTLDLRGSSDGTTYITWLTTAVSASTGTILTERVHTRYHACRYTAGTTAPTIFALDSQLGE